MGCILKIKQARDILTPKEVLIADYILDHVDETVEKSAQELGVVSKTSAAAWIRFSKRLGYPGLTALKVDLAKDSVKSKGNILEVSLKEDDTTEDLVHKAFMLDAQYRQQTEDMLEMDSLKKAIKLCAEAETIYICGFGPTSIIGNDLMYKLQNIGRKVVGNSDSYCMLPLIANMTKNDVVVAISCTGENKILATAIQQAKKIGASVICITEFNPKSSLAAMADIHMYVPVTHSSRRWDTINFRNSALSITDLLYFGVARADLPRAKENLVRGNRMITEMNGHH